MHAVDIYGLSEVMGPGVAQRVRRDQGRAARLGGPLLPRGRRPGDRRGAARRREGRAGLHLADQAGDAGDPLPHPRPHPAAARHRPHDAADGEGHRPHRRHDHPARREPVPDPDRGADPAHARAVAALPVRADARRAARRDDGAGRAPAGRRAATTRTRAGGELAGWSRTTIGVTVAVEVRRAGRHRALGRQDAPHRRPAPRADLPTTGSFANPPAACPAQVQSPGGGGCLSGSERLRGAPVRRAES